jgi:folate-binding protein YgfZ
MTTSQKLLESALPEVLIHAQKVAKAGMQDTRPLTTGPMLFSLQTMQLLEIAGRDRSRFLHAMLSADIASLSSGEGAWATFNDVKGRTISDLRLLVVDDDRKDGSMLALVETGARDVLTEALDKFIIAEKVYFENLDSHSLWLLAGDYGKTLESAGATLPEGGMLAHQVAQLGNADVRIVRLDRSHAEPRDLMIIVKTSDEDLMLSALSDVPRGDNVLLEAARIEAGQPRFGIDFTRANIPLEAGLADRALNFNKGCYPGQEVICRINSLGAPARRLMRLSVAGNVAPEPGTLLFRNSKEVGYITSAVRSQRQGNVAALGYVGKRHCDQGTALQVGNPESDSSAEVGDAV